MKKRTAHQTWLKYIVLVVLGCIVIIPIYYLLVTTFKTPAEATASPMGLPSHFSFSGYKEAFEKMQFPRAFFNTFIITACSVIGIIITSSMLGYVLHRKRELKISKIVFVLILSGMLFPYQMSILGLYKLIRSLGLMNHLASVIFINIACNIPFATFMFRSFVATIPEELEEAAKIDGAGTFRFHGTVIFPAGKRKRCFITGNLQKYRTVFNRLDKFIPDACSWGITIVDFLSVYAEIYYRWCYEWICERIIRIKSEVYI